MSDVKMRPVVAAVWEYHHDEHGIWWKCTSCGKICRKNPREKRYCSRCGAEMKMEGDRESIH